MGFRLGRGLAVGASLAVMVASMQGVAQAGTEARVAAAAEPANASVVGAAGQGAAAGDAAKRMRGLTLKLRDAKGGKLDRVSLKADGGTDRKIVIGKALKVSGKVPQRLLSRVADDSVALQNRSPSAGSWKTVAELRIRKDGTFADRITPTRKRFLHQREYRVTATVAKTGKASGSVSATDTTTATSGTTTATGVTQFVINFTNSTGDNLTVFVPTAITSETTTSNGTQQASYQYGSFDVDNKQTVVMTYTNPPQGTAVSWYVNKQNCVGQCTNYTPNWNDGQTPKSITCASSTPEYPSGSTTNVDLTSQFGAGYGGSIVGPAANCSFQLGSGFQNWWENHPVEGWIAVVAAVVIIAVLITVAVVSGGAAVPEEVEGTLDVVSLMTDGDTDTEFSTDSQFSLPEYDD